MGNVLSQDTERQLARQLFNRTWELIESQDRTAEQDQMMLVTACAAYLHWDAVGTEENRAIANWQIAHVASLLGYGDLALSHATSALGRVRAAGLPAWLHASALEALARAHAAAGNQAQRDSYLKQAIEAVAVVVDAEERQLISAQIATVPRAAGELRLGPARTSGRRGEQRVVEVNALDRLADLGEHRDRMADHGGRARHVRLALGVRQVPGRDLADVASHAAIAAISRDHRVNPKPGVGLGELPQVLHVV